MNKKLPVAILSASLAISCALATEYTWKPNAADPDNVVTNVVHYYNGTTQMDPETTLAPTDALKLAASSTSASQLDLTLPPGDVVETPYMVSFLPKTGGSVRLDATGAVWRQPNAETGDYSAWTRAGLRDKHGTFFILPFQAASATGSFMFSNAVFRLACNSGNNHAFDLDQGLFDLFSPNGVDLTGITIYAFDGGGASTNCPVKMSFHAGSCFRSPTFLAYGARPSNELIFDGGDEHYIYAFALRWTGAVDTIVDRTKLVVTGLGTKLTLGSFESRTGGGVTGHRYRVSAKNGAKLVITGNISQAPEDKRPQGVGDFFEVMDGAELKVGKQSTTFTWANALLVVSNAVVDSTVTAEKSAAFSGNGVASFMDGGRWRGTTLDVVSGSTLRIRGGGLDLQNGIHISNYGSGANANLVLDGGESAAGDAISVGFGNNSAGTLVISNGAAISTTYITHSTGATGRLFADGGTLRAKGSSVVFVSNLAEAACGAGGLTIDSDYAVTIPQSFSDMDGARGELILTGSGTKTLSGTATTVSRIVAAGGTVVFAAGARAASELVVTNGAKVVFSGTPSDVGLKGLVLGDGATAGVLSVPSGQTVSIDGDVVVNNASLALDGAFDLDTTSVILEATGTVSAESAAAWADALISSGLVGDRSYSFTSAESGGTTTFKMSVAKSALEIVQETGIGEHPGAVSIGRQERLLVAVSNDAVLTVGGKVSKGCLDKVGGGKLYLTNVENVLYGGVFSEAGLFSVPTAAALGGVDGGDNHVTLGGGTLEFSSTDADSYAGTIEIDAGTKKSAVVKNDGDLSVAGLSVTSGDFVKRGAGKLVVEPPVGTTWTLSADQGRSGNYGGDPSELEADVTDSGAALTTGYTGFNIVEGELVFKGDSSTTFNCPHSVLVGLQTANGSGQPALTVDGANASFGKTCTFGLGNYQRNATFTRRPRFTVRNGANVSVGEFVAGRGMSDGNFSDTEYPTTTVENATLSFSVFRGGNWYKAPHALVATNSTVYCDYFSPYGPNTLDIANSVIRKNKQGDGMTITINGAGAGRWTFRDGSTLAISQFEPKPAFADASDSIGLTLVFDGATWETGGGTNTFHIYGANRIAFQSVGAGLTLPVADGKTAYVARAIAGEGGIVKTGAGSLVFETQGKWNSNVTEKTPLSDPVSLAISGLLDVREGSVSVEPNACRAGGAYRAAEGTSVDFGGNSLGSPSFAGAGTFSNFSAKNATIVSDGTGTAVPLFSSAALSGTMRVDFGRTTEDPLDWEGVTDLPVARFSGAAPDVSGWKVRGIGAKNVGGTFTAEDGVVRVSLSSCGMTLIFR